MENTVFGFPMWLEKMYPGKTGRDQLGLGSVAFNEILPTLAPSINVLTFHPRYHSFYVFLLDEYWKRDLPRNKGAWISFFRPREFIFSVGSYLCENPEHGDLGNIVGGRKTGPLASANHDTYLSTTHYIESELGGYGLYYRTVMAELEIIYPGGRGLPYPVDVPSDKYGKPLAEAFRQSIRDTAYYQNYFDTTEIEVPRDVIQEYIHSACLCQLKTHKAADQELLRKIFLAGGHEDAAAYRGNSLKMFLDISAQTTGIGLDEDEFRQLLFFNETQSGAKISPHQDLTLTYKYWRLYQAREYYSYSINAMWWYICYWGISNNGDRIPIAKATVENHFISSANFEYLAKRLALPLPELNPESALDDLFKWIKSSIGDTANEFDEVCKLDSPINEHILYQLANENPTDSQIVIPSMLLILVLQYLRFGSIEHWQKPEWAIAKMGSDGRLSMNGFMREINRLQKSKPMTIADFAQRILEKYIIRQHILVATRKLPDNTFRFRWEGYRLRFFHHDNSLAFMNSRFDSISTTVFELGFTEDLHLSDHRLTEDGLNLQKTGADHG